MTKSTPLYDALFASRQRFSDDPDAAYDEARDRQDEREDDD